MITNGEEWYYIALKSVRTDDGFNRPIRSFSRLFEGITANHYGDFYCLKGMKYCVIIMIIAMQKYLPKVIKR